MRVGPPHLVKPVRAGPGGYLFAWTAALSFGWGLCVLAVSPAFEVVVPPWVILAYGAASALLALSAPVLDRPSLWRPRSYDPALPQQLGHGLPAFADSLPHRGTPGMDRLVAFRSGGRGEYVGGG